MVPSSFPSTSKNIFFIECYLTGFSVYVNSWHILVAAHRSLKISQWHGDNIRATMRKTCLLHSILTSLWPSCVWTSVQVHPCFCYFFCSPWFYVVLDDLSASGPNSVCLASEIYFSCVLYRLELKSETLSSYRNAQDYQFWNSLALWLIIQLE